MAIQAGDLLEITCEHAELGSKVFEAKSGEDYNMMPGGFKSNDDDGNITAGGTRIDQLNRYPWSIEPTLGANEGDIDYLQSCTESALEGNWTFTFMGGATRVGKGKPVGDLTENRQAGTIAFKISGGGRLDSI